MSTILLLWELGAIPPYAECAAGLGVLGVLVIVWAWLLPAKGEPKA